jgi:hypothetical protein
MSLTHKHLKEVCLLGHSDKSKTCRYLRNDELDEEKWYCQKLQPSIKKKIDRDVLGVLNKNNFHNLACADNCPGYPLLKHVPQGFDID